MPHDVDSKLDVMVMNPNGKYARPTGSGSDIFARDKMGAAVKYAKSYISKNISKYKK